MPSATRSTISPSLASPPLLVAARDPDDSRFAVIERVCAACGARVHRFSDANQTTPAAELRCYAAAVVALDERPVIAQSSETAISGFAGAGLCVIAYANGVAQWPVSARCRVLLAGTRYLLESGEPDFQDVLAATLRDVLKSLSERRDEATRIRELAHAHGIVGESESLLDAFRQIVRLSRLSDLPVLITGESGTGKELFASALHALDPKRSQRPMVAVNCAAINIGVAESELFGHVRGAFTGAGHDRAGFFLASQGGVLFLDEIGELNLDVQAKILRVVQERRFLRVGAEKDMPVDVRIIAATNQDLAQRVRDGCFRADLFHRLNSLSLHISPLRERLADVPLLVDHFVASHASWSECTGIDADLIDALSRLELKGNVRELKNLITAALAAKADRRPLGLKDLPHDVWKELSVSQDAVTAVAASADVAASASTDAPARTDLRLLAHSATHQQGWNLSHCLAQCEREIVQAAMRETHNNQSQAARLLGLTPRSIYNKLRKYQLLRKSM